MLPQALPPSQPRSRKPTLDQPDPRRVPQPQALVGEPDIQPGDLICALCGAGNTPDRRFCRRCGNSLATAMAAITVKQPWYRRIFGRGQQPSYEAGDRPAAMGRANRRGGRLKWIVLVVVLALVAAPVIGYFTMPGFKSQVDALVGRGGTSALLIEHPSTNALDKNIDSFWLADQASGKTVVTVNFGQTTDLAGLIFHVGAPGGDYAIYGRPREAELIFPGDAQPITVLLDDSSAAQQRCLAVHESVRTFDIRIVSSYPPSSGADKNLVALREVEFIAGSCP